MQVTKPGGTREQMAVAGWLDCSDLVRARLASVAGPVPSILSCFDIWSNAVACLGECELHARALERSRALDIFEERRSSLTTLVSNRNEAGIEALEHLRQTLPNLGRELGALQLDRNRVAEVLGQLERSVREHLADWEMKGSDAEKLMRQFVQIGEVVRSAGPQALSRHLDSVFAELISGRRAPDRGTHENMPWWKWMFLAGAFGWMIAASIVWGVWRGDRTVVAAAFGIIELTHWIAFVFFC